jgi:hypothetical protein
MPIVDLFRELSAKEVEARTANEDVRPGGCAFVNKTGQSFDPDNLLISEVPDVSSANKK